MDGWDGEMEWERNGIVKDVMLHIIFFFKLFIIHDEKYKMIPGLNFIGIVCDVLGGIVY